METKIYTLDATGAKPGRLATQIAHILLGKNTPDTTRNLVANVQVVVENASKLDITEKRGTEIFQTYSGYQGGQKSETWAHLAARRGISEVLTRIVGGMLPKNKLRTPRLKNLVIKD